MEKLIVSLGAIALMVIIAIIAALPTMWLWNWLMPLIFGLIKLTWIQAAGVNLLCTILFRSVSTKTDKE